MAAKKPKVKERDLAGFKYLNRLQDVLGRLHDVGCARDRAGNRNLHFDQYCLLILLSLFNPVVRSLRACPNVKIIRSSPRQPPSNRRAEQAWSGTFSAAEKVPDTFSVPKRGHSVQLTMFNEFDVK